MSKTKIAALALTAALCLSGCSTSSQTAKAPASPGALMIEALTPGDLDPQLHTFMSDWLDTDSLGGPLLLGRDAEPSHWHSAAFLYPTATTSSEDAIPAEVDTMVVPSERRAYVTIWVGLNKWDHPLVRHFKLNATPGTGEWTLAAAE